MKQAEKLEALGQKVNQYRLVNIAVSPRATWAGVLLITDHHT
jgi:hypothetical protein